MLKASRIIEQVLSWEISNKILLNLSPPTKYINNCSTHQAGGFEGSTGRQERQRERAKEKKKSGKENWKKNVKNKKWKIDRFREREREGERMKE